MHSGCQGHRSHPRDRRHLRDHEPASSSNSSAKRDALETAAPAVLAEHRHWQPSSQPRRSEFKSCSSSDRDRALRARGLTVWFDELNGGTVGDSPAARSMWSCDSRFGVVVISPHFLDKEWPQRELGRPADVAKSMVRKAILPVAQHRRQATTRPVADRLATASLHCRAMGSTGLDDLATGHHCQNHDGN